MTRTIARGTEYLKAGAITVDASTHHIHTQLMCNL